MPFTNISLISRNRGLKFVCIRKIHVITILLPVAAIYRQGLMHSFCPGSLGLILRTLPGRVYFLNHNNLFAYYSFIFFQVFHISMEAAKLKRVIYNVILWTSAFFIWQLVYQAGFQEYDENWGSIMGAFEISLLVTIATGILWVKRNQIVRAATYETLLYLLTCSPVTLILVVEFYAEIFGRHFKV